MRQKPAVVVEYMLGVDKNGPKLITILSTKHSNGGVFFWMLEAYSYILYKEEAIKPIPHLAFHGHLITATPYNTLQHSIALKLNSKLIRVTIPQIEALVKVKSIAMQGPHIIIGTLISTGSNI